MLEDARDHVKKAPPSVEGDEVRLRLRTRNASCSTNDHEREIAHGVRALLDLEPAGACSATSGTASLSI